MKIHIRATASRAYKKGSYSGLMELCRGLGYKINDEVFEEIKRVVESKKDFIIQCPKLPLWSICGNPKDPTQKKLQKHLIQQACDIIRGEFTEDIFNTLYKKYKDDYDKQEEIDKKSCYYFKSMKDFGIIKTTYGIARARVPDESISPTISGLRKKFLAKYNNMFNDAKAHLAND